MKEKTKMNQNENGILILNFFAFHSCPKHYFSAFNEKIIFAYLDANVAFLGIQNILELCAWIFASTSWLRQFHMNCCYVKNCASNVASFVNFLSIIAKQLWHFQWYFRKLYNLHWLQSTLCNLQPHSLLMQSQCKTILKIAFSCQNFGICSIVNHDGWTIHVSNLKHKSHIWF